MNKAIMKAIGFNEAVKKVNNGICPSCGRKIQLNQFHSPMDIQEYRISGLCQKCIDEVFGNDEMEE